MWVYVVVAHGESRDVVDSVHWTGDAAEARMRELGALGLVAHVLHVEVTP